MCQSCSIYCMKDRKQNLFPSPAIFVLLQLGDSAKRKLPITRTNNFTWKQILSIEIFPPTPQTLPQHSVVRHIAQYIGLLSWKFHAHVHMYVRSIRRRDLDRTADKICTCSSLSLCSFFSNSRSWVSKPYESVPRLTDIRDDPSAASHDVPI